MSFTKLNKITKSIRFRLTLMYSLIIFCFTSLFVLGINLYLNEYFKHEPQPPRFLMMQDINNVLINIPEDQLSRIKQVRKQDLRNIQEASVFSLIPLSILSFVLGYYVSGKFLHPLRQLNDRIEELSEKKLGQQLVYSTDDEIGELAQSFNKMSQRLKIAFDNQTQFIEDASHELRTPLTIIQTNLDFALNSASKDSKAVEAAIHRARQGMNRVTKLTEYLLDLSRQHTYQMQKTDLSELVQEQISILKPYAKEHQVQVKFDQPQSKIISYVDQVLMGRAIFNILENAIKYSSSTKSPEVSISIESKQQFNIIKIADNGPGIAKSDQVKVFNRFYRTDQSRSSQTGGFGLGLSIVKKIVEEHQGKVSLKSSKHGTIVEIHLAKPSSLQD